MSADAKMWQDENDEWHAVHDGDCTREGEHEGTAYDLDAVMASVKACIPIRRWMLHVYPDGKAGLRGFTW